MSLLCLSTILILVGMLPSKGSAIICYSCNSAYDPGCGDPIRTTSLGTVNCSWRIKPDYLSNYESKVCRKVVQNIQGTTRVIRTCGYIEDETRDDKECLRRSGTHEVNVFYCSCKSDLCNGVATPNPLHLTLVLLTSLVILMIVGRPL